jgi:lysyl-tRNA synthetase, class II
MDLSEELLRHLATEVLGRLDFNYQGVALDFSKPFERLPVADAVLRFNPQLKASDLRDREALAAHARTLGIKVEASYGWGRLQMEIFEATGESQLVQPTFLTAYPIEVSPLSRRSDADPELADRFELIIAGREYANGFSELNDPFDQAERFKAQMAAKDAGDKEAMHFDADYIRALEVGMAPTAGEGIGIDRLVMLLTDSPSIRDVILFPTLRLES